MPDHVVEFDTVRFPAGEFEGTPVLRINVEDPSIGFPELHSVMSTALRPGHQALWFDQVPWGAPTWDTTVRNIQATGRFSDMPCLTIVPIAGQRWGGAEILWIADASALLADPVEVDDLRAKIQALGYYPELAEIVIRNPARQNLIPGLLDEVHANLRPQGLGWVYCSRADAGLAFGAVSRAMTLWGTRSSDAT